MDTILNLNYILLMLLELTKDIIKLVRQGLIILLTATLVQDNPVFQNFDVSRKLLQGKLHILIINLMVSVEVNKALLDIESIFYYFIIEIHQARSNLGQHNTLIDVQ